MFHLSLDFIIAILATLWVLFVFSFGGWLISLWEQVPEELGQRGSKYTQRAVQAIQDPTGRENLKNVYFGIIMGLSAALPSCLHLTLFLVHTPPDTHFFQNCFKKSLHDLITDLQNFSVIG